MERFHDYVFACCDKVDAGAILVRVKMTQTQVAARHNFCLFSKRWLMPNALQSRRSSCQYRRLFVAKRKDGLYSLFNWKEKKKDFCFDSTFRPYTDRSGLFSLSRGNYPKWLSFGSASWCQWSLGWLAAGVVAGASWQWKADDEKLWLHKEGRKAGSRQSESFK